MNPRAIHMVGIGGAGMSGLARLAVQAGYRVSGTDRADSAVLADLRALGVDARAGHDGGAVPADARALVVSTAIGPDNPDVYIATARGLPIIHRADLLAELMDEHRGLAVAGAHGKSTTSGMLVTALGTPSACVGATIPGGGGTGAVWGTGPWFVAEADESDRSLLKLRPAAAILLNVDHDHHATYATIDEVEAVFATFVAALPSDGVLIVGPDERARSVGAAARCPVQTVGDRAQDTWRIVRNRTTTVMGPHGPIPLELAVPGRHNAENATCALALAVWCGVDAAIAADRLATFTGVGRRFEHKGTVGEITVVDDYAHHPAELLATLTGARERHPGRIIAVFQPHLYSRTKALTDEIATALTAADVAIVTDIYAAREPHDPSIHATDVVAAVPNGRATYASKLSDAADHVMQIAAPGDLILTLGAGDITTLGQELVDRLQRRS